MLTDKINIHTTCSILYAIALSGNQVRSLTLQFIKHSNGPYSHCHECNNTILWRRQKILSTKQRDKIVFFLSLNCISKYIAQWGKSVTPIYFGLKKLSGQANSIKFLLKVRFFHDADISTTFGFTNTTSTSTNNWSWRPLLAGLKIKQSCQQTMISWSYQAIYIQKYMWMACHVKTLIKINIRRLKAVATYIILRKCSS